MKPGLGDLSLKPPFLSLENVYTSRLRAEIEQEKQRTAVLQAALAEAGGPLAARAAGRGLASHIPAAHARGG